MFSIWSVEDIPIIHGAILSVMSYDWNQVETLWHPNYISYSCSKKINNKWNNLFTFDCSNDILCKTDLFLFLKKVKSCLFAVMHNFFYGSDTSASQKWFHEKTKSSNCLLFQYAVAAVRLCMAYRYLGMQFKTGTPSTWDKLSIG